MKKENKNILLETDKKGKNLNDFENENGINDVLKEVHDIKMEIAMNQRK